MTRPLRVAGETETSPARLLGAAVHYPRAGTAALTELEPDHLAAHQQRFGRRPTCTGVAGQDLLDSLARTALTGRGGGHFPVAAKWRRVLTSASTHVDGPLVVANGAEGEPLSRKDSALLELRPHLVLDGLACAVETVGATDAVLWLIDDAHAARAAITRALAERAAHRLDDPPIRVALGPRHYLTGESSAVVRALSGGPARPAFTRVPAAAGGIGGRRTLVQNVESLTRVALLARGREVPTVLLTIATAQHLVVCECPDHGTLGEAVINGVGGLVPQAVLVGGYGGRWLPWDIAAGLPLRQHALSAQGFSLGPGIIAPLAQGACGLRRTADIVDFLAESSARQCGPCQSGLPAIAQVVRELGRGHARRRDTRRLDRFLFEVNGRGACHHPDGAIGLVRSALDAFADDVAEHLLGRCLHGAQ